MITAIEKLYLRRAGRLRKVGMSASAGRCIEHTVRAELNLRRPFVVAQVSRWFAATFSIQHPVVSSFNRTNMSVRIMSKVWDSQLGSHTEKLVLLALADNANDEGLCWPSRKTIARKCDLSETAVRNQIKEFESAGLISITETGGGHLSNRYQFDLQKLDEMAGGVTALGGQRRDPVGQCRDPQGATALPAGGNGVRTNHKETKIKPSVEPPIAFPIPLQTTEFTAAWLEWTEHRKQKRIPLTELSVKKQLKFLESFGSERAVELIDNAIRQGWQSIYDFGNKSAGRQSKPDHSKGF